MSMVVCGMVYGNGFLRWKGQGPGHCCFGVTFRVNFGMAIKYITCDNPMINASDSS